LGDKVICFVFAQFYLYSPDILRGFNALPLRTKRLVSLDIAIRAVRLSEDIIMREKIDKVSMSVLENRILWW